MKDENSKNNKNNIFMIITTVLLVANLAIGIANFAKPAPKLDTKTAIEDTASLLAEKEEQRDVSYLKTLIEDYPMNNRGKYPTSLADVADGNSMPELKDLSCDFQGRGSYKCSYKSTDGTVKTFSGE